VRKGFWESFLEKLGLSEEERFERRKANLSRISSEKIELLKSRIKSRELN